MQICPPLLALAAALLDALHRLLSNQQLDEHAFFILSVLCIRDNLSLSEINTFVSYTGHVVTAASMRFLEKQHLVAVEGSHQVPRYVLTATGRETSEQQLALAKAVEENLSSKLGPGDAQALKVLLKRLIAASDPGLPDLWAPR